MNITADGDEKRSGTERFSKLTWQKKLLGADLSHAEFRVLLTVSAYANADGTNAYPGLERIISDAVVSRSCAVKSLKALESKGWLRVTRRSTGRGNANVYRLRSPRQPTEAPGGRDEGERESVEIVSQTVLSEAQTVLSESETVLSGDYTRSIPDQRPEEKTPSPSPRATELPLDWQPNAMHRYTADGYNIPSDEVDELAERFCIAKSGKCSTSWDRDFGGLINSYHEDPARAEIDYELDPLEDSYV